MAMPCETISLQDAVSFRYPYTSIRSMRALYLDGLDFLKFTGNKSIAKMLFLSRRTIVECETLSKSY